MTARKPTPDDTAPVVTPAPHRTGKAGQSFGPAPCSAFVRLFKPQFAGAVLSGEKCQTVRPVPKRMPKPGDRISLRCWTGKPYRSKQRILRDAEISRIEFVEIAHDRIVIAGRKLTSAGEWAFARADGFNTPQDMLEWFNVTHGLPFIGVVIYWQNSKV